MQNKETITYRDIGNRSDPYDFSIKWGLCERCLKGQKLNDTLGSLKDDWGKPKLGNNIGFNSGFNKRVKHFVKENVNYRLYWRWKCTTSNFWPKIFHVRIIFNFWKQVLFHIILLCYILYADLAINSYIGYQNLENRIMHFRWKRYIRQDLEGLNNCLKVCSKWSAFKNC